jgi:hypothetical protein
MLKKSVRVPQAFFNGPASSIKDKKGCRPAIGHPFFFRGHCSGSFGKSLDLEPDIVDVHLNDFTSLTLAPYQPFPYPLQNQGLADAEHGRSILRGKPGFPERHCSAPFPSTPDTGRARRPFAGVAGYFRFS